MKRSLVPAKEIETFIAVYKLGEASYIADIHIVDMSGWTLFECFLHPTNSIIYFGWDEGEALPEWIDMKDDYCEQVPSLLHCIVERERGKAA